MHHHRRRKKRPNYGMRTVEVNRGLNGFGFTISGQQPCILSCIVPNSPADLAGLRAGDFLISVNSLNVSKYPHEAVVQLIGNSVILRMTIAENYYSDSSEEENQIHQNNHRVRPKYPNNRLKLNRITTRPPPTHHQKNEPILENGNNDKSGLRAHNVIHSPNASNSKDISNVSAMVRTANNNNDDDDDDENEIGEASQEQSHNPSLEYRAVVGYLGTIEMPKQIATSSKLQTVRSCIRKMRQEKRNPTTVLMTILPSCLTLRNNNNAIIAKYPSSRLNYVSSSSENDNRFFGLVTSAIYADGQMFESSDIIPHRNDIVISNSCHVFVIDTKLVEHTNHIDKVDIFKIICTKDPISNICLEFPNNSEYVVNLIRSMYTLKSSVKICDFSHPIVRNIHLDNIGNRNRLDLRLNQRVRDDGNDIIIPNSPQPSEITTTSSNSDSGIGFHNDCTNISDRILVVDFPGLQVGRRLLPAPNRPLGIINDVPLSLESVRNIRSKSGIIQNETIKQEPIKVLHTKSLSADMTVTTNKLTDSRLTVRAMPDRKIIQNHLINTKINNNLTSENCYNGKTIDESGNIVQERPVDVPSSYQDVTDLFFNCTTDMRKNLQGARSCDDIMIGGGGSSSGDCNSNQKQIKENLQQDKQTIQMSFDDITLLGEPPKPPTVPSSILDEHIFLLPKPVKKLKKPHTNGNLKNKQQQQQQNFDDIHTVENLSYLNNGVMCGNGNTNVIVGGGSERNASDTEKLIAYKLSPKVFGVSRPFSISVENLSGTRRKNTKDLLIDDNSVWGSLQELRCSDIVTKPTQNYLPGTYSEPDLREEHNDESRALTSGTSPFRRWGQSSLRSRSGEIRQPLTRRPSSLAASDNDVYTKSIDDQVTGERHHDQIIDQTLNYGPTSWSTSFEKLLNDSAGLHTFAEFLKKEFSAENIYFWTACERYIQLDNNERKKQAEEIFSKHLAIGAPEPVNVDSHARTTTQENLQNAEKNLFLSPQKQIFNLMKFDSYARFIRSDLYKSCVDAANKNQPAPYPGEQLDALLRTGLTVATPIKLKKSLSNADDRRRKSLLPWHRKTRCKSKDRDDFCSLKENTIKTVTATTTGTASIGSTGSALKISNSGSDIHSSRSSLSSFDAVISSRSTNIDSEDNRSSLCRVLLSDGATTIVQTKNSESIRDLVERLLEKRGICYQAYEAFLSGNNKPMDLENPSVSLAGKEVQIEQRVIFKLDLPNRKVISVKSKPCKALGEVLRPILHKYNFKLDLVQVFSRESTEPLDMTLPVTVTDGQRLQVLCKPIENLLGEITQITTATTLSTIQKVQKTNIGPNGQIIMNQPTVSVPTINQNGNSPPAGTSSTLFLGKNETVQHRMGTNNLTNKPIQQSTLDEITNKVFNELLQGKVESHSAQCLVPPQQRASDQGSIRSEDWGSETSSGIFGRLRRRDSNNPGSRMNKIKKLGMPSKSSTAGSEDGIDAVNANIKKPLIAKWKAGVKLQVTGRSENHDLLEGLKRAQRSRLEDQRGTEINFELPDFLKDKENLNNNKFRKLKRHPNDINPSSSNEPVPLARSILEDSTPSNLSVSVRPQPAPRLSINSKNNNQFSSVQSKINELENSFGPSEYSNSSLNLSTRCLMSPTRDLNSSNLRQYSPRSENSADTTLVFNHHEQDDKNNDSMNSDNQMDSSFSSIGTMNNYNYNDDGTDIDGINHKGPPPLPPKPKILPIKPSNWGQNNNNISSSTSSSCGSGKLQNDDIFKVPQELPRRLINEKQRNVYLDQPSSSFV